MTPTTEGQVRAIYQAAERSAGLSLKIDAVEGHGTGTVVGDKTEITTICNVYSGHSASPPIYLGSAKAIIGHTMAASGALSLVKAALAIVNQHWPQQPVDDQRQPSPLLDPARFTLRGQSSTSSGSLRRVAVNSFGFGGTNSHIVLESPKEVAVDV